MEGRSVTGSRIASQQKVLFCRKVGQHAVIVPHCLLNEVYLELVVLSKTFFHYCHFLNIFRNFSTRNSTYSFMNLNFSHVCSSLSNYFNLTCSSASPLLIRRYLISSITQYSPSRKLNGLFNSIVISMYFSRKNLRPVTCETDFANV